MIRTLFVRGLVVVVSTVFVIGCGAGSRPEGDLPPAKVGTPEDMDKLQKDLLQQKTQGGGSTYKAPPGVNSWTRLLSKSETSTFPLGAIATSFGDPN